MQTPLRPVVVSAVLLLANLAAAPVDERDKHGRPYDDLLAPAKQAFALKSGDVVAFIGGEATVVEGELGHIESLLTAAFPDPTIKYRNLGWEGDTVFERPRDLNFPSLIDRVKSSGATVVFCQFGQAESFAGPEGVEAFAKAYEAFGDELSKQAKTIVLVTPTPFWKPNNPQLPDLKPRNADLRRYVDAIRGLAVRRGWWCVDLFHTFGGGLCGDGVTDNGLRPSPWGSAMLAARFAQILSENDEGNTAFSNLSQEEPVTASPRWKRAELEALRQAIVAKNKLWFDYTRPMNWAFLGGDRMQVPSSRDHRDPNVRWFPGEMEKFVPLIEEAERKVDEAARKAAGKV